jgi:aspartyl aminopeptidase
MREELNRPDRLPQGLPDPFHATASLVQRLEAAGFQRLDERDSWAPSLAAATTSPATTPRSSPSSWAALAAAGGIRLVGAHTDSPCLRVKPQPELQRQGFCSWASKSMAAPCWPRGSTATCRWPAASPSAATARSKAS